MTDLHMKPQLGLISVQKMVSISASLATAKFNQLRIFRDIKYLEKLAMFDARVFQVPNVDVVNT
jgi:tRNA(His) 5'-end guanylyltransferase